MSTELKAPSGKTRVISVDLFDHSDYLVGDYEDREEAFRVTDDYNKERHGSMSNVYYAYDDTGRYIRGNKNVNGPGVSP